MSMTRAISGSSTPGDDQRVLNYKHDLETGADMTVD